MSPHLYWVACRPVSSSWLKSSESRVKRARAFLRALSLFGWTALCIARLTPAHAQSDDETTVTVTGTRPAIVHGARDTTAASTVLLREQLDSPGATSADVLSRVPGVTVLRAGAAAEYATASIRGTDSRQVPVYFGGIRLNDDVGGTADISTIPLWMVQRVEIYRGNSPHEADRSGLAGALFFEPLHPAGPAVGGNASVGSYGERAAWLSAATGSKRASTLFALRLAHADNDYVYLNDHGKRFQIEETREKRRNADSTDGDAWVVSDYRLSDAVHLNVLVNALDRAQGATSLATAPAEQARSRLRRLLGGITSTIRCSSKIPCKLALTASSLVTQTGITDPALELRTARGSWTHHRGERHSQSARLSLTPWEIISVNASVEHGRETLRINHPLIQTRTSRSDELNVALNTIAFSESALSPQLLLRTRCSWTDGHYEHLGRRQERRNSGCNITPPDARLGVRYQLSPGLRILANASHFTREPTLGEMYGVNPAVNGNPNLQAEISDNLDLGVEGHLTFGDLRFDFDAFGFARWAKQLIRYRQTSLNAVSPFNEERARILGAEGTLVTTLFQHWALESTVTALDPRRLTDRAGTSSLLPLFSRLTISEALTGSYAWPEVGVRAASVSVRYQRSSSRYFDDAGLIVLPRQETVDAELAVALVKPDLRIRGSVNNLLNRRSLDLLGLPLPGISYHAALEAWWR
jgi:vitamin B12 transporter